MHISRMRSLLAHASYLAMQCWLEDTGAPGTVHKREAYPADLLCKDAFAFSVVQPQLMLALTPVRGPGSSFDSMRAVPGLTLVLATEGSTAASYCKGPSKSRSGRSFLASFTASTTWISVHCHYAQPHQFSAQVICPKHLSAALHCRQALVQTTTEGARHQL